MGLIIQREYGPLATATTWLAPGERSIRRRSSHCPKSFTLVELLVVIRILVTFLLPVSRRRIGACLGMPETAIPTGLTRRTTM